MIGSRQGIAIERMFHELASSSSATEAFKYFKAEVKRHLFLFFEK